MNDEGVDLLVRTHQDGTATPAHVFNRGAASVFQHWRHADRRKNDHWLRNDLEHLLRHGFHPVQGWQTLSDLRKLIGGLEENEEGHSGTLGRVAFRMNCRFRPPVPFTPA